MENEKYFEEKFLRVTDKLEDIHEEVKETNNRVTHLEEKVHQIELNEVSRGCPNTPKVDEIMKELPTNKIMRRIVFGVVGLLLSFLVYQILALIAA